jgi:transposase-like protein
VDAHQALERFRTEFDAKDPKAVAKLDRDRQYLTTLYDFPVEHRRHLGAGNAIESSFATVKLRARVTKGAGSKNAALCDGLQAARRRAGPLAAVQRHVGAITVFSPALITRIPQAGRA